MRRRGAHGSQRRTGADVEFARQSPSTGSGRRKRPGTNDFWEVRMFQSDDRIRRDIEAELEWDYSIDESDVSVEVSDGKVTLTGKVPSYTGRSAATAAAFSIAGVREVNNLLAVDFPPHYAVPDDSEVRTNAQRALDWSPYIHGSEVEVEVKDGVAELKGTVDAYWKRRKAEDLVSELRGVIDVRDHLAVVPTHDFADEEIAESIEGALLRNLYVDADKVTVKVENGEVTLTGALPSYYARRRAHNAAAFTPGVREVDDTILIA